MRLPTLLGCAGLVLVLSIPLPAQPELSVFFGNLHSHTGLSDGSGTPFETYEHARDVAGLDFLAITEHNHAQAGDIANNPALYTGPGNLSLIPTANSFVEEGEYIALYGQEFSTISSGNHVNVIDAPRVIDVANGDFRTLLETWLPANLDTQGQTPIVLLNHPDTNDSPQNLEYGIDDFADTAAWLATLNAGDWVPRGVTIARRSASSAPTLFARVLSASTRATSSPTAAIAATRPPGAGSLDRKPGKSRSDRNTRTCGRLTVSGSWSPTEREVPIATSPASLCIEGVLQ